MVKNKMMLLLTVFAFGASVCNEDDDWTLAQKAKKQLRELRTNEAAALVATMVGAGVLSSLGGMVGGIVIKKAPVLTLPEKFAGFLDVLPGFAKQSIILCGGGFLSAQPFISPFLSYFLSGCIFINNKNVQLGRLLGLGLSLIPKSMPIAMSNNQVDSITTRVSEQPLTKAQLKQIKGAAAEAVESVVRLVMRPDYLTDPQGHI